jgi:signal transduction histidine kinase
VELAVFVERCWETVATEDATLVVEVERTVRADRSRLQQLFANLFRNAIEHGEDGATVTVGPLDGGFYVEDDGPGIPEADRDDVSDIGYSTTSGGTGLGLGIVAQVVEAHDWTLRIAESAAGGARFEITGVEVPQ